MSDPKFWSLVKVTESGCMEWRGTRGLNGYGRVNRRAIRRSPILAHRYSWFLATGEMPPSDMHVCHRCDNPPCVNPEHLFLETARDNSDDKIMKGRATPPPHSFGVEHHMATKSDAVVREVRYRFRDGDSSFALADEYGIAQATVMKWVHGEVRMAAGGPICVPERRRSA